MDINDSEKLIESFKERPRNTIFAIVIFLFLISVIALVSAFFSEKGKQAAGPSKETPHVVKLTRELPQQRKSELPTTIHQRTEGHQSPIVNVGPGGKSTINYGEPKEVH